MVRCLSFVLIGIEIWLQLLCGGGNTEDQSGGRDTREEMLAVSRQ